MAPKPYDDPRQARMQAIAKLALARVGYYARIQLDEAPACRLDAKALQSVGGRQALVAMLELPEAVVDVLSNRTIAIIVAMVGWSAMYEAVEADVASRYPPRRRTSDS